MSRRAKLLIALATLCAVIAVAAGATLAVRFVSDRHETDKRLVDIAQTNRTNGEQVKQALQILLSVTGPDAQAKQGAVLDGAITDLRRSIDCADLYVLGKRPPACADVDGRMDALAAGGNPFTQNPGGTP